MVVIIGNVDVLGAVNSDSSAIGQSGYRDGDFLDSPNPGVRGAGRRADRAKFDQFVVCHVCSLSDACAAIGTSENADVAKILVGAFLHEFLAARTNDKPLNGFFLDLDGIFYRWTRLLGASCVDSKFFEHLILPHLAQLAGADLWLP